MLFKRAIAIILDGLVLAVIGGIVGQIIGREVGGLLGFIIGAGYQAYFLSQHRGQTPGKMLLGIRVVKTGGGRLTPIDGVLRYIGYYLNTIVFMLGWVLAIFTGRGFHDHLAGTKVSDA